MSYQYLPGFEPDFDVKQELRFIGGMPDLHQFDYVYISCSGGKDSHAMAYILSELATMQNYDKNKMELIYADTGLEWHDTFEQVKRIGKAVNIKAVKVLPKYKLLDNVRRRWAKFNGLPDDWQNGNEGIGRQTDSTPPEKRKYGIPIPKLRPAVLQQRSQAKSDQAVCPFPSHGVMFCRSWGKTFPLEQYIRAKSGGGGR